MKIVLGSTADGDLCVDLPVLIESRVLVQAQSGAGKSWALRRLLEQTHGRVQQIIIDPEGEFGSLREKFDYVLAGKGGDTPAEPRSAKLLARRLYELGVSAIIDISELHRHEQIRFVRVFLEALIAAPKEHRHESMVVIDEAHIFCPEKGQAESAQAVIDLCTLGRKRGLCAVLATQRLSKLHKDAAAELRNKLIGATGLDIDQVRAGDDLGFGKADRMALRDLKPGEFYAYGPALSAVVVRLTVGAVQSRHPKVGERGIAAPPPPTDQIKKVLAKLADLPAEAEQEAKTIEDFKRDNADLRRKLTLVEKTQRVETKPCDHEATIGELRMALDAAVSAREVDGRWRAGVAVKVHELQALVSQEPEPSSSRAPHAERSLNPARSVKRSVESPPVRQVTRVAPSPNGHKPTPVEGLSASQQRILDTLAKLEVLGIMRPDKSVVAVFAGVSPTSGGYFNNLGRLRSMELIDYPEPGTAALTEAGLAAANAPDASPTLDELHDSWCRTVGNSPAQILRALIAIYPNDIGKNELAESIGVSPTSGGYFNNLGRLRSLGAIDYPSPGRAVATSLLFPEGLA